jgi:ATP-dependent NAD(P)H-hydrate dehydratase
MSALLARGRLLQHCTPQNRLRGALRRLIGTAPANAAPMATPEQQGAHGTPSEADLLTRLRAIVPPLSQSAHKGSHGKVGVVGGCAEYTGAPYFAALAALRSGCDLAYVFCTPAAAPVIKSYSPELIVLPCLPETPGDDDGRDRNESDSDSDDEQNGNAEVATARALEAALERAEPWIARLGCLIVGPGLGDDPRTVAAARMLLLAARRLGVPLVIDGSALNFVARDLSGLVKGEARCVLTPNLAEFGRLATGAGVQLQGGNNNITAGWQSQAGELAAALDGPVVVSKGPADVVAKAGGRADEQPPLPLTCTSPASLKRSGGQGDVLTGIMATLICWTFGRDRGGGKEGGDAAAASGGSTTSDDDRLALAAWGACWLMRAASASAFAAKGRAMLAEDILDPHVADAIVKLERSGGGGGSGAA